MPSKLSGKERYAALKAKKPKNTTLTIQPGCLYYDVTDGRPIGNRAYRAPARGLKVTKLEPISPPWYGMNRTGMAGHMRVALNTEMTMEHYHDK